ncbi:hypothetical protein [Microbacterium soli]|uniref:Integral membrane protein n=1 Tax=Microbacterium soli TaxID=446075 RepID=A0ABP7N600_9MICO
MRPSRRIPILRGFVGATIATFLALASHMWVGGGMPGILGILVPWLPSVVVCTLLAGRRLSLLRLSLSVAASQLLFHALFVLGSVTPTGLLAPHVHGSPSSLVFTGDQALVPVDAGMWVAHGVAAVLTIAVLHRGETLLAVLLRVAAVLAAWIRRAVPVGVGVSSDDRPSQRWAVVAAPVRRAPVQAAIHRRGPPPRLI